jgi:hypothetical protein
MAAVKKALLLIKPTYSGTINDAINYALGKMEDGGKTNYMYEIIGKGNVAFAFSQDVQDNLGISESINLKEEMLEDVIGYIEALDERVISHHEDDDDNNLNLLVDQDDIDHVFDYGSST